MLLWYYTAFPQQQPFHDTQGKLEISNTGAATYTLPIARPPSLKNTGPLINIVYQSGLFTGIVGQGWNIQGISAISRIPSRIDLDGQRQGIRFTNDDKLALNGQRLLVVSGEYWHIGSVYQTEIQSNLKIELQRSGFGLYFIVTAPDGSRSWYGNYDNNSTDLSAFYIRRYEDPLGNFITYHYTKPFAKSLCISEIRFSGNTHGLAPLNSIQFHYKKAQRTESAYARGQKLEKIALLSHIEVKTNNQLFRKYEFTHITDPQLGYEKVSQIQEFNGAMEPANPVIFEYENTETLGPGSELLTTYHNNLNFDSIVLSGDFDGDDRLDFTTENQIFTNNFLGTTGQTPVNSPIVFDKQDTFTATTLSVNKLNPFQSIVKFSEGEGFKVYNLQNDNLTLSYTKRFDFPTHLPCFNPSKSCTSAKNAFLEGDFNGDGISEVLLYKICRVGGRQRFTEYECGQFLWVDLNPNISSLLTGNSLSAGQTPGVAILPNPDLLIGKKRYVGDFNGDGKSDIFIINPNGTYKVVGFKQLPTAPWVEPELLGKGTLSTYSENKQILFGDFNGDGKTDVMLPRASGKYNEANDWWDIYYSNPKPDHTSFFTMETFRIVDYWQHSGMHFKDGIQYSSYYVLDTNGDGKSDLVRIWRNYYKPKWTINDHDTNWKITSFVNNIGKANASGFVADYITPCQNYDNSCDHHSDSPDMVIPIVSTYRHGINKEILMVRNHYNQVTYVNFTKDVAKDNLLKKVTTADGALVYEIAYQPLDTSDQNDGYGNPDEFYSSSHSVSYPNVEIKRLPFNRVVSRLTHTVGEITRHQDFKYHGYTVNMLGLGTLGFTKTARSSWYQNPSDSKIWNVMHNDPTKRGLLINTYAQLQRSGATFSFSAGVSIPENVISSMVNEFAITTNNKVYTPLLTRQTTTDYLTSVKTVTDYLYQPVFCLPEIVRTQNFSGTTLQGETTVETEYENNPLGTGNSYYIGRTKKNITTKAYPDEYPTETRYTYNANGTLQKTQQKPLEESYFLTEDFEYDRYGNILKKTISTPGSAIPTTPRVTEYTYDTTARFMVTNKDVASGQVTQYTYHPLYGTVTSETDPNQLRTTTAYDPWGKPLTTTDYLGKRISYSYIKRANEYITKTDHEDGSSAVSVVNALGQSIRTGKTVLDGLWYFSETEYDYLGRKARESDPFQYTPSLWTTYMYDEYGRLIETVLPTGKTNRISYNGLTVTTDHGNRLESYTKNANGHIVSSTDTGGTISFKYNAYGAVTESDFQGFRITTEYDNWGRKSRLSDPSAGEYRYTYYPFGELRTTVTPKGIVKNFIDDYGRTTMTEEEATDGTNYYTRYYYNADTTLYGSIREEYLTGKVTNEEYYEYDDYKRPKKITLATPHATFIKELTYDAFGRIDKEKQTATVKTNGKTSSKTFRYTYQFGYRHQILDDATGQALWTAHSVNARDQLTQGAFGNGLHIGNQYDDYGYIQRSDTYHPNRNTSAGRPMLNLVTQFDIRTGNLTARKNNLLNHSATFQYDTLDRLVQWDNETVMLHHDTFDQAIGEFEPKTCATLTNENGSLKVAITPNCTGIKKVLLTKAKVGDQLKIRFDFNKGTTHITRISIWEYNPDNGQYFKSPKDYTSNGTQSFEHTVTQYPVIELHFDTLPLAETYPMLFFLDNLLVTMDRPETQQYDDNGRITENKLGYYNYNDNGKPYQNTSIDLFPEDASYYQNREGIFNDGMEEQKGWSDLGLGWDIFGKPTYDDSKAKSGKYSLKIHNPTDKSHTLHADRWIPIDNPHGASYTFSGWVYSDGPTSQLFLFMNSENETGYYTIVADQYTEVTHQWVYMERTVYVPAYIKKLSIRVDNNGGGNVWFDDIRIRKTENPKTDIRQLNVTYDLFKKPISITETGVEKVAFSYTADHFRNAMYYGGLEDPEQQPFRKDYAADGSMEITTNQQTGASTFVFFVGGDAYSAPVVFKDNGTTSEYLYLHRDYQGTIVAISDQSGNFVEKRLFDPWGKLIKVQDEQNHNLAGLTLLDRGYTGHEHIQGIGIINMNGRIYDPKLHRFLSPDNYVQDPYNTQNYNRYGYCWNNPLKYTDPSGEFIFTALACIIPGGQVFLPWAIGADIGMWSGGSIANGTTNPFKWNYSSGKTWSYMAAGAVVGGLSGGTGSAIAGSGIPMANTAAIASASLINSLGTHIYTGGQSPVSISFGVASYDFTNGTLGYLGKKGNSFIENLGYGFGALANLADINQIINSTHSELYTDDTDFISHSAIRDKNTKDILMSYGPNDTKVPRTRLGFALKLRKSTSDYILHDNTPLTVDITVNKYSVNLVRWLGKILPYQGATINCVNMSSLSLWLNGIPNIGIHPYLLHATTWAYSVGIRPDLFTYYFNQ